MEENTIQAERLPGRWAEFVELFFQAVNRIGQITLGEPNKFRVETVPLTVPRLHPAFSGFRMAQISDIHMGGWMTTERLQEIADLVIAQRPDVLLITGDFLKGRSITPATKQGIKDVAKVLRPLAANVPCFAVLGNHDYHTDPDAIRDMLRRCKITDLTNAVSTLTYRGQTLHLCGVDDVRHGDVRLDRVLAQLDPATPAILLAHEPDFADISAATGKFDLQVSGHSHGGQVVVPFYGPPRLPESGRKYPSGLYRVGNMLQYTSRGVGTDRFSIRINCPPEISLFILQSAAPA